MATITTTANVVATARLSTKASDFFPNGGWDVHHHIFDPSIFSYSPDRHLTPPPATIQQFRQFKSRIGATHSVLIHGLSYGSDCSSLVAFLRILNDQSSAPTTKGIGVIDPQSTTDEAILQMHDAGVRGIRVNLYKYGAMHDLELQKLALAEHAKRISLIPGWTMAMTHTHPEFWQNLRPTIETEVAGKGIRLVTDHFALLKGTSMLPPTQDSSTPDVTKQPGFDDIISLVCDGLLWVKLSAPYRVSNQAPHYADLEPLVKALVEANPRRILWGSDWPHTPRMEVRTREDALKETPYLEVDDEAWLRSLKSWMQDWQWDLMVRVNPGELYDW